MFGVWIGKAAAVWVGLVTLSAVLAAEIPKAEYWQVDPPKTKGWQLPLVRRMDLLLAPVQGKTPQRTAVPAGGVLEFPKLRQRELCHWRALLTPPETGDYIFCIAGDDGGALWLSDNETLFRRRKLAVMGVPTKQGEWFREVCQRTPSLKLEKGRKYAIEVAFYNQSGTGFGEVGWIPPGAKTAVPVPLVATDGTPVISPYQVPSNDTDDDALPDDWEREHGIAVDPRRGDQGGFADPNQDGWSLQTDCFQGWDPATPLRRPGSATLYLCEYLTPNDEIYAEGVQCLIYMYPMSHLRRVVAPLDKLGIGCGRYGAIARCVLTAPADGYYKLSLQGGGFSQLMLSDDGTPEHSRSLLVNGKLGSRYSPEDGATLQGTETGWIYLKRSEPRFLEIRHLHDRPPAFIRLGWTLPDGTRQEIPPACIMSYIGAEPATWFPPVTDSERRDGKLFSEADGSKRQMLDIESAKSQGPGWSVRQATAKNTSQPATAESDKKVCLTGCWAGALEWGFTVDGPGYYLLSMNAQIDHQGMYYGVIGMEREIDGVRFYHEYLNGTSGIWKECRTLTPWLTAGKHVLRLYFTPLPRLTAFHTPHIKDLSVSPVRSGQSAEVVRAHLSLANGFLPERGDGGHLISPACIEMSSRTSAMPALVADGKPVTVQESSPGMWWADVALPDSGAEVQLATRSAVDRTESKAAAHWAVTRVVDHPSLYLRIGDALRLSAYPAEGEGCGLLVVRGREIGNTREKPYVLRFDKAGEEVVESRFTPVGGAETSTRMVVRVLPRRKQAVDCPWGTVDSGFPVKNLNPGEWPDGGDMSGFRPLPVTAGLSATEWYGQCARGGIWPAALRAGPHGPVLGRLNVRYLETVAAGEMTTEGEHADTAIMEHQVIGVIGLPPGWKIGYKIIPGPGSKCRFAHPDPKGPDVQTISPWRVGPLAIGEFFLQGESLPQWKSTRERWLVSPQGEIVK